MNEDNNKNQTRIDTIDFVRGLAVVIMIFANSTPYLFDLKDIYSIRFIFSVAAPIFIFLAGFTSQMNFEKGKQVTFNRIFQILLIAVFIDIAIWRSVPFYTFDVLYLIAVSKFLLLFIQKINKPKSIFIVFIALALTYSLLTNKMLFRFEIPDLLLSEFVNDPSLYVNSNPLTRFLFDGWFPIFPWVFIILTGSLFYKLYTLINVKQSISFIIIGLATLIFIYFQFFNAQFLVREKYLELFYPLNNLLLLIPISISIIILGLIKWKPNLNMSYINLIGKYSLFSYLMNALIDAFLELYNFNTSSFIIKILVLLSSVVLLIILLKTINTLKSKPIWAKIPMGLKFILGF